MTPQQCTAAVTALAATGVDGTIWIVAAIIALALIAAGVVILLRRRQGTLFTLVVVLLLAVAAGTVGQAAPIPASAADGVTYGAGCTLITVEDVVLSSPPTLVPGDTVTAITATVHNPTNAAITIRLDGAVGGPRQGPVTVTTSAGGADGPTTLPAHAGTTVTLSLGLPADADNTAQGVALTPTLTITATQQ